MFIVFLTRFSFEDSHIEFSKVIQDRIIGTKEETANVSIVLMKSRECQVGYQVNIGTFQRELYAGRKRCVHNFHNLEIHLFMPPRSKIGGHIVFVLSVILSFCNSVIL